MRKFIRLFVLLLAILALTECKKGEDDPAISLRTRKARLEGEWRLVSGNASYTTDAYNESYVFKSGDVSIASTLYYPMTGKYFLSLNIEKDGKFNFKELFLGIVLEASGTWNFNTGVGEEKKKEDVIFSIDKVKKGYTNGANFFNRNSTNIVYKIKELRNKRLVISSAGKIYSDSKGRYATLSTEYIFQQ